MRPFFLAVFIRVTHDGLNERGPFHARIRFGEKWRASSKRHKCKKENGGLGDEGKNKNLHALKMDGMSLKGSSEHEGSGLENASYVKAI